MRLIDADALCRNLTDWQYGDFARVGHEVEYDLLDKVLTGVGAAPTIDAVPVVRCQKCKYCTEHYDTDGNVPYWTCSGWDSGTDADGFCHYGKRKDGDGDD